MPPNLLSNNIANQFLTHTKVFTERELAYIFCCIATTYFPNGHFCQFGLPMIFSALHAFRAQGRPIDEPSLGDAITHVPRLDSREKMDRPEARRIIAVMAHLKMWRNRAMNHLPCLAMHAARRFPSILATCVYGAVTVLIPVAGPFNARICIPWQGVIVFQRHNELPQVVYAVDFMANVGQITG